LTGAVSDTSPTVSSKDIPTGISIANLPKADFGLWVLTGLGNHQRVRYAKVVKCVSYRLERSLLHLSNNFISAICVWRIDCDDRSGACKRSGRMLYGVRFCGRSCRSGACLRIVVSTVGSCSQLILEALLGGIWGLLGDPLGYRAILEDLGKLDSPQGPLW
jgi:hypothetical protein